jgi:hypothetical protein
MTSRSKKKLMFFLGCGAVYLIFLACLLEHRAGVELVRAREHRALENFTAADSHYFQALNWYLPWGSPQTAASELAEMAAENLEKGAGREAYQSLLRLRGALLAARSFYIPNKELVERANNAICLFLAAEKLGPAASRDEIREQAGVYYKLYSLDRTPGQSWYFLGVLGFLIWAASGFWFVRVFFGRPTMEGVPVRRAFPLKPALFFIFGYVLWVVAMSMA